MEVCVVLTTTTSDRLHLRATEYMVSILQLSLKKTSKKIGNEIRDVEKVCCNAKEKIISGEIRFSAMLIQCHTNTYEK